MSGSHSKKGIGALCTDLGFPIDGPAGRDTKKLKRETASFRARFAQEGHPLPSHGKHSPEAEKYALAFCGEENRGGKLWPNQYSPSWTKDKGFILRCLAHIFYLQAYNQHKTRPNSKKKGSSPIIVLDPETDEQVRELSPESRLYIGPSPPKGTRRRPIPQQGSSEVEKSATDLTVDMSRSSSDRTGVVGPEVHIACTEEIDALDPRKDDQPIKEFTTQWLEKPGQRWPVPADARLKTFMHEHNFYDAGDNEQKVITLINKLRKGTEIEECIASGYQKFNQRVLERIGVITRELLAKCLVEQKMNERPQKTPCFQGYWDHRHSTWGPRTTPAKKTPTKRPQPDIYDFNEIDEPSDSAARVRSLSFVHARNAQRMASKPDNSADSASSRKADEMSSETNDTRDRNKRQRLSTRTTVSEVRSPSLASPPITRAPDNNFGDDNMANSDNDPGYNGMIQEIATCLDDPDGERNTTTNRRGPSSEPNGTAESRAIDQQPVTDSSYQTPPPSQQRLAIILQKSASHLDLDWDDILSSKDLRTSTVSQFFQLYSEHANVPLKSLDCLTFHFLFARGNDTVIQKGDDAAWRKLIRKTKVIFTLHSERNPDIEEFEIVVEIGDKKTKVVPVSRHHDDDW